MNEQGYGWWLQWLSKNDFSIYPLDWLVGAATSLCDINPPIPFSNIIYLKIHIDDEEMRAVCCHCWLLCVSGHKPKPIWATTLCVTSPKLYANIKMTDYNINMETSTYNVIHNITQIHKARSSIPSLSTLGVPFLSAVLSFSAMRWHASVRVRTWCANAWSRHWNKVTVWQENSMFTQNS